MKNKFKAIVFDFDGVVVDSEPLYEETATELFSEYGITIPKNDWKIFKGVSEKKFFELAIEKYKIDEDIETLIKKDKAILKDFFTKKLDYMPGFLEFLNQIKNIFQIGLVTSSSRELLTWIYSNTKINDHFKYTITSSDIDKPKPDPEPFLAISKMLDISIREILVIEDSINGLKSAKAAGASTIGFLSSFSKTELKISNYFSESFEDVAKILGL